MRLFTLFLFIAFPFLAEAQSSGFDDISQEEREVLFTNNDSIMTDDKSISSCTCLHWINSSIFFGGYF